MSWPALPGDSEGFVNNLIRHMTLAEKIAQLDVLHPADETALDSLVAAEAIGGLAGTDMPAHIQTVATQRARLGIPLLLVDTNPQLAVPAPVLAASWDEEVARNVGHALAQETIRRGCNAVLVRCGIASDQTIAGPAVVVPVSGPLLAARLMSALAAGARNADTSGAGDVMIIPRWVGGAALDQAHWARAMATQNQTLALDAPAFSRRAATQCGYGGMLVAQCRRLHAIIAARFRATGTRTLAEAAERAIDDGAFGFHELEGAVRGVLAAKHALGLFRHPERALVSGASLPPQTSAAETRRRGMVLLRNDAGLFPLSPISDRVLVVGPTEGPATKLADALSRSGISFLRAPGLAVRAAGADWEDHHPGDPFAFSLTRDAAQRADFTLIVLDDRHFSMAQGDDWPRPVAPVPGMLRALASGGSRLACLLVTETPVDLGDADQYFAAVLQCGPDGPDLAEALAEVLSGREGPRGRISVPVGRYSFGQGLSFAECTVSAFRLEATVSGFAASVKIRNAGSFPAHEIAQLYIRAAGDEAPHLADYTAITLSPGEETRVAFALDGENLGRIDESGEQSLIPGPCTIAIGKHHDRVLAADMIIDERRVRALSSSAGVLRVVAH